MERMAQIKNAKMTERLMYTLLSLPQRGQTNSAFLLLPKQTE